MSEEDLAMTRLAPYGLLLRDAPVVFGLMIVLASALLL
jgi:hypothetical protein